MIDHAPRQQVFISFSTKDLAVAEEVKRQLVKLGFDSLFLSADPINGIRAGEEWRQRLETQLRYARVFLPLISANWIASSWCHAELRIAKFMGMSIFPVRIGEGDTSGIADELQDIRVRLDRGEDLDQLRMLLSDMLRHRRGTWKGQLTDLYPAAAAYQESQAAVFFGRDAEIAALARAAVAMSERAPGHGRVLLYTGASGVGKSSLARAGLIPDLKMGHVAILGPLRPADGLDGRPESLTHALARLCAEDGSDRAAALVTARRLLAGSADGLAGHLIDLLFARDQRKLVIIVDQAEEIAQCVRGAAEQWALVETLLSDARLDVAAVLTVRLDTHPELLARLPGSETLHLPPIQRDNLRQVLKEPLRVAGLVPVHDDPDFAGFIDAILEDAEGATDALPLVSQLMADMVAEPDKVFSGARYRDSGGLRAAIARSADRCLEQVTGDDAVTAVREAFLRMVAMDVTGTVRLARLPQAQLPALARPVIEAMSAPSCRLLRVVRDEAVEPAWEPTHESLLRLWPRLAAWLDEERLALATIGEVRRDAEAWLSGGQMPDRLLHRGERLRMAHSLAENETYQAKLGNSETDYLKACNDLETALVTERREREKQVSDGLCLLFAKQALGACSEHNWTRAMRFALAGWLEGARNGGNTALAEAALARAAHHSRQLVACRVHKGWVGTAVFSPDGTRVVTAGDQTARIFDAATGAEIARCEGHERGVTTAAFSPDGTRLVTASVDGTARIFDAATGAEIARCEGHERMVTTATFSPGGTRLVTASLDLAARIFDAATGAEIARCEGHEREVTTAAFSPDGTRVVTASRDQTARIFDAATGAEIARCEGHEWEVGTAAFSPDGTRVVTASEDNTARIFDAATGVLIACCEGHERAVGTATFSTDGARVVTASSDQTARIFDAATGAEIARCEGHESMVSTAAFSPDGTRVVTASLDLTARIFDAATGAEIARCEGHEREVTTAAFSPDGTRVVTASRDQTARIFDAAIGVPIVCGNGHKDMVQTAAFSPDGARVVTASEDKTARIFDAATGVLIACCEGHERAVEIATFSPDSARVVTASQDKTARIFEAATGVEIARCEEHEGWVHTAAFSPDGARVVTASADKTARIFDAATGAEIARCDGHESMVTTAAFSPDGKWVVTASHDQTARIFDAATGGEITRCDGHESSVLTAAFSPDGTRVVTASIDGTARIFEAATGVEIARCEGHERVVGIATFSPDSARVVTASQDKTARIFDAATGVEIARCEEHEDWVQTAAFSPDGARVVTASHDQTARIFDAGTGVEIARCEGHDAIVRTSTFSPDGTRVVTSDDQTARIFDLRLAMLTGEALVAAVCREKLIGDERFTQEELRISPIKRLPENVVEACLEMLANRAPRTTEA
ncbi:MAG: TIR domain-containing protein [Phreatobacter sp.]|nr:TIR domain-containing protein [Phreatobacter sp.]